MASIKIYRVSGLILLAYGIVGFFCYLVTHASEKGMAVLSYSFLLGMLLMYAINPFFWVGWILFRKAMKNDQTVKKPAWLLWLLTSYIICGLILAVLPLIVFIGTLWAR
jgi:lipopolysaccharide export LptBFGC system permease protein LptF